MAIVMVVDDDADLRGVIERALARAGYTVVPVGNGQAALEAMRAGPAPDLILTDLEMPGGTGLQLIATTRREDARIPMIAMTGTGRPLSAVLDLARSCGADATIAKPFSLSAITELVSHVLTGAGPPGLTGKGREDHNSDVIVVAPSIQEKMNAGLA